MDDNGTGIKSNGYGGAFVLAVVVRSPLRSPSSLWAWSSFWKAQARWREGVVVEGEKWWGRREV